MLLRRNDYPCWAIYLLFSILEQHKMKCFIQEHNAPLSPERELGIVRWHCTLFVKPLNLEPFKTTNMNVAIVIYNFGKF